jgi:general secretion pathway protein G
MKGEKGRHMLETIKGREAQRRKGDEGFTLIELLVVIVILAILAAIVVFAVGGLNQKGQDEACNTDMKTIQTAEEAFFAHQSPGGRYGSSADLVGAGFLTQAPTLHTINFDPATPQVYDVTPGAQTPPTCNKAEDTYHAQPN